MGRGLRQDNALPLRKMLARDCESPCGFIDCRLKSSQTSPQEGRNGHLKKFAGLRRNTSFVEEQDVALQQSCSSPRLGFRRTQSYQVQLDQLDKQVNLRSAEACDLAIVGKPIKKNQQDRDIPRVSSMKKSLSTNSLSSMGTTVTKTTAHNSPFSKAKAGFMALQPGSFAAFNSAVAKQSQQHRVQQAQNTDIEPLHFRGDSAMALTNSFKGSYNSLCDGSLSPEFSREISSPPPSVYIDPSELVGKDAEPHSDAPLRARETLRGYKLGKTLGKGGFCTVLEGHHRLSGRAVAVKVVEKGKIANPADRKRINFEVSVLKKFNHKNVIKLYEVVDRSNQMYLVMEHCPDGSLLEYVKQRKQLKEDVAAALIMQIVSCLKHVHSKGIVHRDVKLENLLFQDGFKCLKLIDFGLSGEFQEGRKLTVSCGSPSYAAPEIHKRQAYVATPVDVWSTGVVLYAMLFGTLPFRDANKSRLSQKIISGKFHIPEGISPYCKDLLCKMLTVDPSKRITIDQILKHPWIIPHLNSHQITTSPVVTMDTHSGAMSPHSIIIQVMKQYGHNTEQVQKDLAMQVCSGGTAAYYLLSLNLQDRYNVISGSHPPMDNGLKILNRLYGHQVAMPKLVLCNDSVQGIMINQFMPAW